MWGCEGKSEPAGDRFFAELDPELAASSACPTPRPADPERPPEASEAGELQTQPPSPPDPQPPPEEPERRVGKRASKLKAISLDMNPGYAASARQHAPQAIVYIDPYHVVQLANQALDEVRRAYWNQLRALGDQQAAKRFKDARRALLNKPKNLTDTQAATLDALKTAEGEVWRAYALKEAVREIFEHGLSLEDVTLLLDRLLSRPSRSRLHSSGSAKRSANTAMGSSPPSASRSTTDEPKRSTTRSDSSPAAPTDSTPPTLLSRSFSSPADPSPCNRRTNSIRHDTYHIDAESA